MMDTEQANAPSREWLKFGVLVAIMLVVVVGVAVTRPLIFNQLLPRIVQVPETETTPTPTVDTVVPTTEGEIEVTGEPVVEPGTGETVEETPEAAATPTVEAAATETAVVVHIVQPGDNLTKIAQRYGTTVDAIVAANQLSNPNRVVVGTSLRIPQP